MKKNVVFIGTRSWYRHIVPAVLSLIEHTQVDMIYLLIEDDVFPYDLPCKYKVVNVSEQNIFPKGSINYNNYFTYVCLLRVALTKLLPDVDQVLSLDDDIIVADDISPMWDVDLTGKWLAAVPETYKWGMETDCYYNCGVVMYNLKQMRQDGIDDKLIEYLNTVEVTFSDQVAINWFLKDNQHKAVRYDVRYNEFCNSGSTKNPAIIHYCGYNDWMTNKDMPRVEFLETYQQKFCEMYGEKPMKKNGIRYMIHACPKRMWYVEEFLLPEMISQGIEKESIIVWNDTEGWGNLKSFVKSMEYCRDNLPKNESVWHIQDDVILSPNFHAYTERHDELSYGFCNKAWDADTYNYPGVTTARHSWHSFQCVCIPNRLASDFTAWFAWNTRPGCFRLLPWTKDGVHDDVNFRLFLSEEHPDALCVNVRPNLVDHIDFLIGGTTLYKAEHYHRSMYWEHDNLIDDLQKKIKERAIEGCGAEDE